MQQEYTISAIATPLGEGGIGIIRISGSTAIEIAENIFKPYNAKKNVLAFEERSAIFGHVIDESGNIVDEAICIIMKAPHSYTCEDVVELQCHGGSMVMQEILSLTYRMGARPAERGEFTKRAFLNGRLDLSQAQAVMDVIQSKTKASLRVAAGHLNGQFSKKIEILRNEILNLIAHLEVSIDYPEEDIESIVLDEAREKVDSIIDEVQSMIDSAATGIILREGLQTAIIGRPNAGKSSLMNRLLGQERAIVTDIPGTTRDSIEEYANIGGVPLRLADTAGIRTTDDVVEKIGVEKAYSYAKESSLVMAVFDGSCSLQPEDEELFKLLADCTGHIIIIINKGDLDQKLDDNYIREKINISGLGNITEIVNISANTGAGVESLEKSIKKLVYGSNSEGQEREFVNDARQKDILLKTIDLLKETRLTLATGMSEDFVVIDLRSAWEKLGEITGQNLSEDIIDHIFKNFCLGK